MNVKALVIAIVASTSVLPAWAGQSVTFDAPVDEQSLSSKLKSFVEGSEYQVAVLCFKTGERVDGMNKICFYDCLGSAAAITIGATQLCPLSINR